MASKNMKCKFCTKVFNNVDSYASHLEKSHLDMIPPDMSPKQFIYILRTGKEHGTCVMCGKDTKWNEKTGKYHRFCEDPACKEKYVEEFRKRMMDKHGKITMLNDPEQQREMLAKRRISGIYVWSDRVHKFSYTGSYEKAFLEFLDHVVEMNPDDIMTPSPHNYFYTFEGKRHFYFPDVFIPSLNLEIEIKDGGDNPNMHHKIQEVDKVKEKLKDDVLASKSNPFNYLKLTNKNHMLFFKYLEEAKKRELSNDTRKIVMI